MLPKESSGKNTTSQGNAGHQGIRSLDATTLFRITNFELFVKPNKYVMAAGLSAVTLCFGYLYYWRQTYRNDISSEDYIALNEDETETIRKRSSRWQ